MSPSTHHEPEIVGASERPVSLVGVTEQVPVAIDARAHRDVLAKQGVSEPRRILLHLEDIEANENPGSVYGVYVNLPEGADQQQLEEHHVGNLSFFGIEQAREPHRDQPAHGVRSSIDITNIAHRLEGQGEWDREHVHVTLRPLGLRAPEGAEAPPPIPPHDDMPVRVGRVSVSYA